MKAIFKVGDQMVDVAVQEGAVLLFDGGSLQFDHTRRRRNLVMLLDLYPASVAISDGFISITIRRVLVPGLL